MLSGNTSVSLKDAVSSAILEDILSHKYEPQEILNEKDLVKAYGCSKSPVREALLSLCNDGVLRSIPRCGYEIVRLTVDDVNNMLHFRYIIESGLLTFGYMSFTPNQIARLVELDAQCSAAENDLWHHWDCNAKFHVKMITFCKNYYAAGVLQQCMDRLKRAYAQLYWDNLDSVTFSIDTRSHKDIIQGLQNKDLDFILSSLKKDLMDFGGPHSLSLAF